MFPALVNCCTIDWFREWPAEALASVATSFFQVSCYQPLISEFPMYAACAPGKG